MQFSDDHKGDGPFTVFVDSDLEDLIPGFFEYRRQDVEKMRAALEAGDFDLIRIIGHGMKGAGGGYGFDGITDIGRTIEHAAKEQDRATIEAAIVELVSYMERVQIIYR